MPASGRCASSRSEYIGRFAPSPTGPLHFGSLTTALASFLRAKSQRGRWLVRMEDLDRPREVAGAGDQILRTLEALGLEWDGNVMYQSRRQEAYDAALQQLRNLGWAYACGCTRREIAAAQPNGKIAEPVYPGTCRQGLPPGRAVRAWRVLTTAEPIHFEDLVQGNHSQVLERQCGDFVIRRADRLFAYQLAVVVDDAAQAVTEVVRGCDLLHSTARQIHLQRLLALPTPDYLHLPVATDAAGNKLSKQTGAAPIDPHQGGAALYAALKFLGQRPPQEMRRAAPAEVLCWAAEHWDLDLVPRQASRPAQTG